MSVGDITGIFSRFFIVGFLVPCFAAIAVFEQLFWGPVREADLLLIAGLALLLALLLIGLGSPIWGGFEGYPRPWRDKQGGKEPPSYPTKFGEATRRLNERSCKRWGLNAWAVWPYVEALFSAREREIHVDALANVRFFLNVSMGALPLPSASPHAPSRTVLHGGRSVRPDACSSATCST